MGVVVAITNENKIVFEEIIYGLKGPKRRKDNTVISVAAN